MVGATVSTSRGRTLALGFATTVAMWAIAYLSMMSPGMVLGEILFAALLSCVLIGGVFAGRDAQRAGQRPAAAGAKVGLAVAALNLFIVGSLLQSPQTRDLHEHALLWVAGNFGVTIILAAAGGLLGRSLATRNSCSAGAGWFHLFTRVAAIAVFLLLITGGLVTGLEAGLAVPDWPNSFGHNMLLYPLSEMRGGIYYEHAHRLYGMLVGVTAITLAISAFCFDQRRWLRGLCVGFLAMVCVQGVMGGTRVTETSIGLAIMHGVFGQLVFATIACIAAFTSPTWKSIQPPVSKSSVGLDRVASAGLLTLMLLQLILGALYRHLNAEPGVPASLVSALLHTHILGAALVLVGAIVAGGRAWGFHRDVPVLPRVGGVVLVLVGGQIMLGIAALIAVLWRDPGEQIPAVEVIITSAHQVTGALLLAAAALLYAWTRRLTAA